VKTITLLLGTLALAQAPGPTFRSAIERVQLDVSVTRGGRPLADLTAADFVVTDNGTVQTIESARLTDLPLSIQLVLDVSGSVSGTRLKRLIEAGQRLLATLTARDRVGLITFSNEVHVRVGLTADFESVRRALADVTASGMTSVQDAMALALELPAAADTRPLVLLFTDGHDTTSWLTHDELIELARRADVVIHVVEVPDRSTTAQTLPERLAEAAGGRVWQASSDDDLARLFTRALEEMRSRYVIAFTPSRTGVAGWHELKVRLKNGRADIKARPGYFVNAAK